MCGPAENRTRASAMRMLRHTTRPQAHIVSRETIFKHISIISNNTTIIRINQVILH